MLYLFWLLSMHNLMCFILRDPAPKYGFVILNTLHSESSIVTISPGMEFRVQESFLLYKNESGLCDYIVTYMYIAVAIKILILAIRFLYIK